MERIVAEGREAVRLAGELVDDIRKAAGPGSEVDPGFLLHLIDRARVDVARASQFLDRADGLMARLDKEAGDERQDS